jgi:hypothetical protein
MTTPEEDIEAIGQVLSPQGMIHLQAYRHGQETWYNPVTAEDRTILHFLADVMSFPEKDFDKYSDIVAKAGYGFETIELEE